MSPRSRRGCRPPTPKRCSRPARESSGIDKPSRANRRGGSSGSLSLSARAAVVFDGEIGRAKAPPVRYERLFASSGGQTLRSANEANRTLLSMSRPDAPRSTHSLCRRSSSQGERSLRFSDAETMTFAPCLRRLRRDRSPTKIPAGAMALRPLASPSSVFRPHRWEAMTFGLADMAPCW